MSEHALPVVASDEPDEPGEAAPPAPPRRRRLLTTALFALVVFALAFGVRAALVEPFLISGPSMAPTLLAGDYVLVGKYAYAEGPWARLIGRVPGLEALAPSGAPERGDVIVFRNPREDGRAYVKRVVGIAGDTVALKDGAVVLNGRALPHEPVAAYAGADEKGRAVTMVAYLEVLPDPAEGGLRHNTFHYRYGEAEAGVDDAPPVTVPDGGLFVLGDNRDESIDSRRADRIGLVPLEAVQGRVERVAFSLTPGFRLLDPRRWGEFRWGRTLAPARGEMRF